MDEHGSETVKMIPESQHRTYEPMVQVYKERLPVTQRFSDAYLLYPLSE